MKDFCEKNDETEDKSVLKMLESKLKKEEETKQKSEINPHHTSKKSSKRSSNSQKNPLQDKEFKEDIPAQPQNQ